MSICPEGERSMVLIDLNDTKHPYLERIDLEGNSRNNEGCKCINILIETIYSIYVLGGMNSLANRKFTRFTTHLIDCAPMPGKIGRYSFAVCTVFTQIYVIGGYDGDILTGNCDRFDT